MNSNEQAFLENVRKALGKEGEDGGQSLFTRPEPELAHFLEQTKRSREERLQLLAILKETAVPLNLRVHAVSTLDAAADGIAEIARTTDTEWGGKKRITTHDTPLMAELDLTAKLSGDGIAVDICRFEPGEDEAAGKQRLRGQAEAAYIGVTGAGWCAVDCAALALLSGPGRGRATSLVPSVHIAVLPLDRLVAELSEIYAHLEALDPMPAAVTFISGPSKTADIEAQLVHGAHGPREMHLFVVTG